MEPHDRQLSDFDGLLSTRSEQFRARPTSHDVRLHQTGRKRISHPYVSVLDLDYEALELSADPGRSPLVYTAQPDTPTRECLDLLASSAATPDDAGADTTADARSPRHTS